MDYLYEHIDTFRLSADLEEEGNTEKWGGFVAKHLDYLTNPSIRYKNKKVIENLINNYLPSMDKNYDDDESVFHYALKSVKKLLG